MTRPIGSRCAPRDCDDEPTCFHFSCLVRRTESFALVFRAANVRASQSVTLEPKNPAEGAEIRSPSCRIRAPLGDKCLVTRAVRCAQSGAAVTPPTPSV